MPTYGEVNRVIRRVGKKKKVVVYLCGSGEERHGGMLGCQWGWQAMSAVTQCFPSILTDKGCLKDVIYHYL